MPYPLHAYPLGRRVRVGMKGKGRIVGAPTIPVAGALTVIFMKCAGPADSIRNMPRAGGHAQSYPSNSMVINGGADGFLGPREPEPVHFYT